MAVLTVSFLSSCFVFALRCVAVLWPATVLSPRAEAAGLGMSLFERLERAEHEVVMLTVQYRMHPDIRLFPSERFYQVR